MPEGNLGLPHAGVQLPVVPGGAETGVPRLGQQPSNASGRLRRQAHVGASLLLKAT